MGRYVAILLLLIHGASYTTRSPRSLTPPSLFPILQVTFRVGVAVECRSDIDYLMSPSPYVSSVLTSFVLSASPLSLGV